MTITREPARSPCRRWLVVLALAGLSFSAAACDRAHLSSYYGKSYASWFGIQHVHGDSSESAEATKRVLSSLDAQEAAAVSKNYRHTVGSDTGQGQGQMVMIGQARSGGSEGYVPPASVPNGQ